MPNDAKLNDLAADIERLKTLVADMRELLQVVDFRLVEMTAEMKRRRLMKMHSQESERD